MITKDGIEYEDFEDIPDLGSWECTNNTHGKREYVGLSKDVEKLPKYPETGSTAYCADNGDLYMFEKSTKTWYKQ